MPNTTMKQLRTAMDRMADIQSQINVLLEGRQVRIVSGYNGQPLGSSKRAMTGQIHTVRTAWYNDQQGDISMFLEGQRLAITLAEVVVLEPEET